MLDANCTVKVRVRLTHGNVCPDHGFRRLIATDAADQDQSDYGRSSQGAHDDNTGSPLHNEALE